MSLWYEKLSLINDRLSYLTANNVEAVTFFCWGKRFPRGLSVPCPSPHLFVATIRKKLVCPIPAAVVDARGFR
jgi:hypothetical protein